MKILQNNQNDQLSATGRVRALKVYVKCKADAAATALSTVPDLKQCQIDLKCDGKSRFNGTLFEFFQAFFLINQEETERYLSLSSIAGYSVLTPQSSGINELRGADLTIPFPVLSGEITLDIRMNTVFPPESDGSSSINFVFDKTQEPFLYEWQIIKEPVLISSMKEKEFTGRIQNIVLLDSNATIGTNFKSYVETCTLNHAFGEGIYSGDELAIRQAKVYDLTKSYQSLILTDLHEFVENPIVNLQLNPALMSGTYMLIALKCEENLSKLKGQSLNMQYESAKQMFMPN